MAYAIPSASLGQNKSELFFCSSLAGVVRIEIRPRQDIKIFRSPAVFDLHVQYCIKKYQKVNDTVYRTPTIATFSKSSHESGNVPTFGMLTMAKSYPGIT